MQRPRFQIRSRSEALGGTLWRHCVTQHVFSSPCSVGVLVLRLSFLWVGPLTFRFTLLTLVLDMFQNPGAGIATSRESIRAYWLIGNIWVQINSIFLDSEATCCFSLHICLPFIALGSLRIMLCPYGTFAWKRKRCFSYVWDFSSHHPLTRHICAEYNWPNMCWGLGLSKCLTNAYLDFCSSALPYPFTLESSRFASVCLSCLWLF